MCDDTLRAKLYLQGFEKVQIENKVIVDCTVVPDIAIIPYGVEGLADGCMSGQLNLRRVLVPSSIKEIGEGVFSNCPNLELIVLDVNIQVFEEDILRGTNAKLVRRRT